MNAIKNFIYKQNDLFIALIILVVAAIIIFNRINVIMEYPAKMAEQHAEQQQEQMIEEETEETK